MTVSIVGAAGYTGGMLLRLLARHPHVDSNGIAAISASHAGQAVNVVHTDIVSTNLTFADHVPNRSDVIFLCMDHGKSTQWMKENDVGEALVIDLGQDHRGHADWVYGLPEFSRENLKHAKRIANPGCFATCIELSLLPLIESGDVEHVIVNATTGSTGAGQAPSPTTHYSWRANNLSVYKAFVHQHLEEISMVLGMKPTLIPLRGSFPRGILATSVTTTTHEVGSVHALYKEQYAGHPFVHVVDDLPDVKRAVGTNNCFIGIEEHEGSLLIVGVIDNLLKGASGQAVQNMNIACGFDESAGLHLMGVGY